MRSNSNLKDFTILLRNAPQSFQILDSAFGQRLITVNEFRQFLGLDALAGGDVTRDGQTLDKVWPASK